MKFWRLMGFITTRGPATRGHAWNFLSVSSCHSLLKNVLGVVPERKIETRNCYSHFSESRIVHYIPNEKHNIPPNNFAVEIVVSHNHATPNDAIIAGMIYLADMFK